MQAKIEAKFQLPISVMVLNPEERLAQAKSQVGFINLFTQPLFDAMASVAPDFQPFADFCRQGRVEWESIVCSADSGLATAPPTPDSQTQAKRSSPQSTPKISSSQFASNQTSAADLPASRSFSSRLPPHRAPRQLKPIDSARANSSDAARSISPAPGTGSSASLSPVAPSVFDRSSSISSTITTGSSWLSPSTVDECLPLGDEECEGNCTTVTSFCAACSKKHDGQRQYDGEVMFFGSPVEAGSWPPDPFFPSKTR